MKNFYLAILAIAISTSAVQAQNFTKGDFSVNLGTGYGPILTPKGVTAERQVPHLSLSLDYGLMQFGKATIGLGVYGGFSQERLTSVTVKKGTYVLEPHPGVKIPYHYTALTHKFPAHTNYKYATIGGKIAINYQVIENLDLYAGTMLGYCFATPGAKNKDLGTISRTVTPDPAAIPTGTNEQELHQAAMVKGAVPKISAGVSTETQEGVKKEITKKSGSFAPIFFAGARYYVTNNIAIFAEGGYGLTYAQAGLSFKF